MDAVPPALLVDQGVNLSVFGEQREMGNVLRAGCNLLVANHMLETDEGEAVENFGRVDQLVDVDIPICPAPADGHITAEATDDPRSVRQRDEVSNF